MKIRSVLVGLAGLALAACSDDPVSPPGTVSGSLSFNYTGAGAATSTSFSASGSVPTNLQNTWGTTAWAAGGVDAALGETSVVGVIPKTSNSWDIAIVTAGRTTTGTSNISTTCGSEPCTMVQISFGSNQAETSYAYFCELTSGTVNITAISSTNVTGTFSGTGTCETVGGTSSVFTVTNGTFNTGISTEL